MTTVTNVKDLSKTNPDWKSNKKYVYIGRPSEFDNPIIKGQRCDVCGDRHQTGGSTLVCYKAYFYGKLISEPIFKKHILELKDKVLVCYCVNENNKDQLVCHGQIIAAYLDKE